MIVYNYSRKDESKTIIESIVDWTITTTYIGKAKRESYNAVGDVAKPIWEIQKRVDDSATGLSIRYRPNKSAKFEFVRNDRATLTYV